MPDSPTPAVPSRETVLIQRKASGYTARPNDESIPAFRREGAEPDAIDSELLDTAECSACPNKGRCTHTRCLLRERNGFRHLLAEVDTIRNKHWETIGGLRTENAMLWECIAAASLGDFDTVEQRLNAWAADTPIQDHELRGYPTDIAQELRERDHRIRTARASSRLPNGETEQ